MIRRPPSSPLFPSTPLSRSTELGKKLFFEPLLSADGTISCATCHNPSLAFTDGRPVSIGIHGRAGQRNAPAGLNPPVNQAQVWDGRAATAQRQAGPPAAHPSPM